MKIPLHHEKLPPEAVEFLRVHLALLHHLWERHNQVKKKYDLPAPQLGLLYHLYGMGPLPVSRLQMRMPGHLSSVTQMVSRMVEHGWVRRRRDERDRRKVLIEITEKARKALGEIEPFGLPRALMTFLAMPPKQKRKAIESVSLMAEMFGADLNDPESPGDMHKFMARVHGKKKEGKR